MRIKNHTSYYNGQNNGMLSIFAFFLVFFAIDLSILFIIFNSGMTFSESFSWICSSFCEAELAIKFVSILLLVNPFFWLALLIFELRSCGTTHNSKDFIKYIDFTNNSIKLSHNNSKNFKEIYYKDIDSFELLIETHKYGQYSALAGLYIKINSGSYMCSISHSPVNLNKLYKIIFYSQYVKNFSYRFTGNGKQTKETLGKIIDDYIENNYRKTFRTFLYSSVNLIVLSLICVSSFGIVIAFLFST